MSFVKKEMMKETEDGRVCTDIGRYRVIKNSEHMTGIYVDKGQRLVTSKPKWSQAVKLAILLSSAYDEGFEDAKERYDEDYYRRY